MSGDLSGAELSTIVLNFTPISRTVAEISVTDRRMTERPDRRTNGQTDEHHASGQSRLAYG